jgi:hypothetical protein
MLIYTTSRIKFISLFRNIYTPSHALKTDEIPLEIEINIKLPDSLNKKTPIHIRYARNGNNISGDVG